MEYTIDEDGREDSGYTSSDGQIKVHAFTGWKAGLVMALIAVVIIAIIVMALGLFIYLLPVTVDFPGHLLVAREKVFEIKWRRA